MEQSVNEKRRARNQKLNKFFGTVYFVLVVIGLYALIAEEEITAAAALAIPSGLAFWALSRVESLEREIQDLVSKGQ